MQKYELRDCWYQASMVVGAAVPPPASLAMVAVHSPAGARFGFPGFRFFAPILNSHVHDGFSWENRRHVGARGPCSRVQCDPYWSAGPEIGKAEPAVPKLDRCGAKEIATRSLKVYRGFDDCTAAQALAFARQQRHLTLTLLVLSCSGEWNVV